MSNLVLKNNQYFFGGIALNHLAKKYPLPVYVYNAEKIKQQYQRLTQAFSQPISVKYACKALSNINILKYLKNLGSGLDTVSVQEIELGLKAGYQPQQIIYTPNCVSFAEIKQAVEMGVVINIDNIAILEQFGHEYGNTVPVCIRINPHIMAGGNYEISTGHIDSKFGISIHQMRHVERIIKSTGINVNGLHMHTGSDILDAEVFLHGAEILFNLALQFPNLEFLDFGSGFKVSYYENDYETNIEDLGTKLSARFKTFQNEYGKPVELWFEPGKYLVSEAGILLTTVNTVKTTTATVFAGVNSGMNHLLRPKLYHAQHQITNITRPNSTKRIYTVVGYICETDTFAQDIKLNEVTEGDILAFHNAGAYGYAMASNYNARLRPAEVLILNGKDYLIRQPETLTDLLKGQIEVV